MRKRATKIFDGSVLEKQRKTGPKRTYRSKQASPRCNSTDRKIMYLPDVAIAMKMHERARDLLEKQRKLEDEKCMVEDIDSSESGK